MKRSYADHIKSFSDDELRQTIADARAAFQALSPDVDGDYYLEENRSCTKELHRRQRAWNTFAWQYDQTQVSITA